MPAKGVLVIALALMHFIPFAVSLELLPSDPWPNVSVEPYCPDLGKEEERTNGSISSLIPVTHGGILFANSSACCQETAIQPH